jgi:type II secretory pathway component GspD/PulD (secretin)
MQAKMERLLAAVFASGVVMLGARAQETPATKQEPQQQQQTQEPTVPGDVTALITLKLKERPLKDVVQGIKRKAGVNIIMDEATNDAPPVTIELENVPWRKALDLVAEASGCVVVQVSGNVLKVEKPPSVFFAFENADIQKVIDTIAKISGANIVVAPEVQGPVTLRLKNIPWRDALEAVTKTLGYVVVEENRGILRVVPQSNMKEDLVTKSFQLRFVRPKSTYVPFLNSPYVRNTAQVAQQAGPDGAPFRLIDALKKIVTPGIGQLEYYEGNNTIFLKDTRPVVDQISRMIEGIDIEPAQVYVDVMFVTTSNRDILSYGVGIGDNGWQVSGSGGQIPIKFPFDLGAGGWDDKLIANDGKIGPFADSALNPTGGTQMPDVIFGALSFTQVTATLQLLKRDTDSEIVQAPKLITLDHQESTIFVGETIRYAQSRAEQGQAGGLQLVVEEAPHSPVQTGFQLLVIPHVIPGTDKMMMDIIPQSDALSGTGSSALAPPGFDIFTVGTGGTAGSGSIALPRIASSTIATKVLLRSAQTAVLGGLTTDTTTKTHTRIPVIGDLPILDFLFGQHNNSKSKQSLIVFVTPQIVRSPEETQQMVNKVLHDRSEQMNSEYQSIFSGNKRGN